MNQRCHLDVHLPLILLLLAFTLVLPANASTNFASCLARIKGSNSTVDGALNNTGYPVSDLNDTTAISYDLCMKECGSAPEPLVWTVFSARFGAWLLPWLALLSQLPFGSRYRVDDIMSVVLAVGSPMFAAQSLALTVLNGRWVMREFESIRFPNARRAWQVLSSLQQSAVEISDKGGMLASLIVLPGNDNWWKELADALDFNHAWSAAAVAQISWVIVAYLFTWINSFAEVNKITGINSDGQSVGSVFLWLLPIVVGWLQVSPKSDHQRVSAAVKRANSIAYRAQKDNTTPVLARNVNEDRAFMLKPHNEFAVRSDEEASAPIYNYARTFQWVASVELVRSLFLAAAKQFKEHQPVNPESIWEPIPEDNPVPNSIMRENRQGSLEHVQAYVREAHSFRAGCWDSEFFERFIISVAVALFLQWGTVGGTIIAVWYTPTIGLGCHSGSYILYAAVGTIVCFLMLSSSFLSFYASTHLYKTPPSAFHLEGLSRLHADVTPSVVGEQSIESQWSTEGLLRRNVAYRVKVARTLSQLFRRLGKVLATVNAIWVVLSGVFQFGNFYNRCYCNSSVLGLGKRAYFVITLLPGDISGLRTVWIWSIVLALGTAFLFQIFIYVKLDLPKRSLSDD